MTAEQWIVEALTIAVQGLFVYMTTKEAIKKNRKPERWAVYGFLIGFVAWAICYFMKPLEVDNG